jgi:hypothetical protein
VISNPSEKLDDKILRKYVRQYIDDIFVEFGEQPSIHLILINDTRQYFFNVCAIFFNIFHYFFNIFECFSIFFNHFQYILIFYNTSINAT